MKVAADLLERVKLLRNVRRDIADKRVFQTRKFPTVDPEKIRAQKSEVKAALMHAQRNLAVGRN